MRIMDLATSARVANKVIHISIAVIIIVYQMIYQRIFVLSENTASLYMMNNE